MNFYSRELVIIAVAGCAHFCNLFLLHTNNASVLFWWVFSLVRLNDLSLSHRFLHSSFFQMKACKWAEFIMFCIYSRSVVSICVSRLHSYPHCEADRSSPHSAESLTLTNMPFKKKHPTVASCYCFENRLKPTPCDHSRSVCSCTGGGWGGGGVDYSSSSSFISSAGHRRRVCTFPPFTYGWFRKSNYFWHYKSSILLQK